MANLELNKEYLLELDQVITQTNTSYSGTFYDIPPGKYLILKHRLSQKPDRVEFGNKMFSCMESESPLNASNNNGDYYWDNSTFILSYIVKNKNINPLTDYDVNFSAHKCRYVGKIKNNVLLFLSNLENKNMSA